MLENGFESIGVDGASVFNGVVSTESMPATAAEVYITYAKLSQGQIELMKALITWRESGSRPVNTASPLAPPGEFDFKNVLETAIRKIMGGDLPTENATVLLEYVKLYRQVAVPGRTILPTNERPEQSLISPPECAAVDVSEIDCVAVEEVEMEKESDKTSSGSGISISAFEEEYIKFLQPTHSASYVRDAKSSFKWLTEKVGDVPMSTIEPRALEQLLAEEYGKASHNAARFYRTLKAAFNKAKVWKRIGDNPFEEFKLPKIPETTAPHFDESDFKKLMEQGITRDYKEFFTFAFRTGMRLSELANLKWVSIEFENEMLGVTNYAGFRTKSKKERLIPITPVLLAMLKERYARTPVSQRSGYVFQRRGKKYNTNYASRLLKQMVRKAGLEEKLHFHSLRHGFGSELIHKNVNPVHVKELMGHANLSTTLRYVHADEDDLRKAVNKLGAGEQCQP